MSEITSLNTTDASNTVRWPENMPPSAVNDGARALEGLLARAFTDALEGNLTSGGSSNAYTLTPNRTLSAYYTGMRFQFKASFANTGAATLNVSSIGQKNIYRPGSSGLVALSGGEIQSNQIVDVIYDGTQFVLLSAFLVKAPTVQVFTANDTWTAPAGCRKIKVTVVGGGGGGGGSSSASSTSAAGGGGGAGGASIKFIGSATFGSSETVTVGAGGGGGTSGNAGSDGGASSFGSHCSATGGQGGGAGLAGSSDNRSGVGSPGGAGSNGDINSDGDAGYHGIRFGTVTGALSGHGGNSILGGGARSVSENTTGNDAGAYGGGGSGGATSGAINRNGGAGAAGVVIVEEYY